MQKGTDSDSRDGAKNHPRERSTKGFGLQRYRGYKGPTVLFPVVCNSKVVFTVAEGLQKLDGRFVVQRNCVSRGKRAGIPLRLLYFCSDVLSGTGRCLVGQPSIPDRLGAGGSNSSKATRLVSKKSERKAERPRTWAPVV